MARRDATAEMPPPINTTGDAQAPPALTWQQKGQHTVDQYEAAMVAAKAGDFDLIPPGLMKHYGEFKQIFNQRHHPNDPGRLEAYMSALRATPEYVAALAAAHNTPQPYDPIPHWIVGTSQIHHAELDMIDASMRARYPG